MSVLFENEIGTFISAEIYFNKRTATELKTEINPDLFKIYSPFSNKSPLKASKANTVKHKGSSEKFDEFQVEVEFVENEYRKLLPTLREKGFLIGSHEQPKNTVALEAADTSYEESGRNPVKDTIGHNIGPPTLKRIQNSKYLFPENCEFFCKDVAEISTHLLNKKFDLILLDPPWWNKYIRRKRKKSPHAYDMMENCDLKKIPIESLLNDGGIVVIWCTNSFQHLNYLINDIFPKWSVSFVAKWYWLKVTIHGEPVTAFSKPPGKQPFEQIIIGYRGKNPIINSPPNGRIVLSVPSSLHSHKPPLEEVLQPYLPDHPKCLEIFARYLLPNWTSFGNEVFRFQHESLYVFKD